MDYFLVIDAGTGSGRAIIFDVFGNQISLAQKEWHHNTITDIPGAINFNTKENWEIIKTLIKKVIYKSNIAPQKIKAISSTSMREGIVFYDKEHKEIWACSNVDARANEETIKLREQGLEKKIYDRTGQTFSLSDVPRLFWIKNHTPNIYKKIHSLGMISDWVIYKLSGVFSFEPSNGSTCGFFDTFTRSWNHNIINTLELPKDIYPKVNEPGTIIGKIKPKLADNLGLCKNTLIVIGGGDAQLGTIGVGSVKEGDTTILGGTFWQQEVNVKEPIAHSEAKVRINAHAIPHLWQYEGISFQIGLTMRWFRDAFCHREKSIANELNISTYSLLSAMSKDVPVGSNGIIPVFSDIMNYMHWKHASPSLMNFNINKPEKYGKTAIFKALMENAAFNTRGNLQIISNLTDCYPKEITFAGGASYSLEWCKILANVLGVPVKIPIVKEATALGAFICTVVGTGKYKNFSEAVDNICKVEAIYLPDSSTHKSYNQYYEKWKKTYDHIMTLSENNTLDYMWKAPGE